MSKGKIVDAYLPSKLRCLRKPARYKILFGGRGAGKSYGVALWLLSEAAARRQRILCCREIQTSIRDSVHRLLSDLIERLSLSDKFEVNQNEIRAVKWFRVPVRRPPPQRQPHQVTRGHRQGLGRRSADR